MTTEDVDLAAPLELRHDGSRELLDRLEQRGRTEPMALPEHKGLLAPQAREQQERLDRQVQAELLDRPEREPLEQPDLRVLRAPTE